jgi:hypothetical protein
MMILRTMVVIAACFSSCGIALAHEQPRYASIQGSGGPHRSADARKLTPHPPGLRRSAVRARSADRDPYADPAAPYKADRLSSQGEPILNIPGQTTVLTRQVLDDMNATSVKDALRSTAGVTVGR